MKETLIACALLCLPTYASAATYFFDPPMVGVGTDSRFIVTLKLDPDDEFINAIEGALVYPGSLLKIISIDQKDSVVSNWIVEPTPKRGEIHFSGVIPGGFDGVRKPLEKERLAGTIFSITFESRRSGNGAVTLDEITSLLNDGQGSQVESNVIPLALNIEVVDTSSYRDYLTVFIAVVILIIALILRKRHTNELAK